MGMPRFLLLAGWIIAAATVAHAETPPLLAEAIAKLTDRIDRWAYTETVTTLDKNGATKRVTVTRFDPSKPYAEQYTPLTVEGREPSESDLTKARRRGEKRGTRFEKAEREGRDPTARPTLGQTMDLEKATLLKEEHDLTHFLVPLRKTKAQKFPPEKFETIVRVHTDQRMLQSVSLRLRESLRAAMVVKLKEGAATLTFETIDPKFPPTVTSFEGHFIASVALIRFEQSQIFKRTDFRCVKPYHERFGVELGPVQIIDF